MNVSCHSCETIYRIDPNRVTGGQARARCKVCSAVFDVVTEPSAEEEPGTQAPSERTTGPQVRTEPVVAPEWRPEPEPQPVAPMEPAATTTPPEEPVSTAAPVSSEEASAPATTASGPGPAAPTEPAPTEQRRTSARTRAPRPSRPITPSWSLPPEPEAPVAVPADKQAKPPVVEERPAPVTPPPQRPSAPVFHPTAGAPSVAATPVPETGPAEPAPPSEPPKPFEPPAAGAGADMVPTAPPESREVSPAKTRPVNPFLSQDPKAKARRLARALVSDMIVYQPEKRQQALQQGNLKEAFEEEIKKSWEEFVEQVGADLADSTSFFNDALNEILAGGQKVF